MSTDQAQQDTTQDDTTTEEQIAVLEAVVDGLRKLK